MTATVVGQGTINLQPILGDLESSEVQTVNLTRDQIVVIAAYDFPWRIGNNDGLDIELCYQ
jgi:hypothetical protein